MNVKKHEGIEFQEEVCMDATALFLSFLQTIDPTACLLCQYEGVDMPPVSSADKTAGFPNNPTDFFLYATMERMWSINTWNHEPDKNWKLWPNVNKMVLHISCQNINLKEFLDIAQWSLRRMQMVARWKLTQLKKSSTKMCLLGVPDGLDSEGLSMILTHALMEAREYLINRIPVKYPPATN